MYVGLITYVCRCRLTGELPKLKYIRICIIVHDMSLSYSMYVYSYVYVFVYVCMYVQYIRIMHAIHNRVHSTYVCT